MTPRAEAPVGFVLLYAVVVLATLVALWFLRALLGGIVLR